MEQQEVRDIVLIVAFFFALAVSTLIFTAYLIFLHEETIQACLQTGQSWTEGSCISMIK